MYIPKDYYTGRPRGIAFIEVGAPSAAAGTRGGKAWVAAAGSPGGGKNKFAPLPGPPFHHARTCPILLDRLVWG